MSFARAKRFDDTPNTKPVINKKIPKDVTKTYSLKSNQSDTESCSSSDSKSIRSVPTNFKVPMLPIKPKTTKVNKEQIFGEKKCRENLEALKEKTVECENKTKYIRQLNIEMEDLKQKLHLFRINEAKLKKEYTENIEKYGLENARLTELLGKYQDMIKDTKLENALKAKIKQLSEQKLVVETHMLNNKEKLNEVKENMNIKEAAKQEASEEYKILRTKCEELVKKQKLLNKRHDKLNVKLALKTKEFSRESEKKDQEINKLKTELKKYQLAKNNWESTIRVLGKRLLDSDHDVEQLKQELSTCESKILHYEIKIGELFKEIRQLRARNKDLTAQFHAEYNAVMTSCYEQILSIRNDLLNRVNQFKEICTDEIKKEDSGKSAILNYLNDQIMLLKHINMDLKQSQLQHVDENNQLKKRITELNEKEQSYLQLIETLSKPVKEQSQTNQSADTEKMNLEQSIKEVVIKNKNLAKDIALESIEEIEDLQKYLVHDEVLFQDFQNILNDENIPVTDKTEDKKFPKYLFSPKSKGNICSPNRLLLESSFQKRSPFREINN